MRRCSEDSNFHISLVRQRVELITALSFYYRMQISPLLSNSVALALHSVEGFALAMMCQYRTQSRKIAINILREVRLLQAFHSYD